MRTTGFCSVKRVVILSAITASILAATPLNAQDYPFVGKVKAERVNLRAGYNKNFTSLKQLSKGDKVIVLGIYYGWYKIELPDDVYCYVAKEYISDSGLVQANILNVRAGPGSSYNVLGKLEKDFKVTVVGAAAGWYKIEAPANCGGWIKKPFVDYFGDCKKIEQVRLKGKVYTKKVENKIKVIVYPKEKDKEKRDKPRPTSKETYEAEGIIKDLGRVIGVDATHKLKTGRKTKYYLKSAVLNLDTYVNRKVRLYGEKGSAASRYPLIYVNKVELLN
ncbi:MAG: SH3 domain-containing protein [Candidatus Omnitrophica bacterium]|nr:SH3 domain-containing protein [Candidatus Omnitrophota bacterium]